MRLGHTLFDALAKEPTVIDAWINAAIDQCDLIVVYERWTETKESFVQNILQNLVRTVSRPTRASRSWSRGFLAAGARFVAGRDIDASPMTPNHAMELTGSARHAWLLQTMPPTSPPIGSQHALFRR